MFSYMTYAPVIQIRARIPQWSLPERLRKVRREETKMTQAAFAALLGIKESTYSAYETGRNSPSDVLAFTELLEEKTGVSKYWFRGDLEGTDGPGGGIPSEDSRKITFGLLASGNVTHATFGTSIAA